MRDLFNRHKARLTDAEDRQTWAAIESEIGKPRRRFNLFRVPAVAVAAAAAVALVIVVVNDSGGPDETLQKFRQQELRHDALTSGEASGKGSKATGRMKATDRPSTAQRTQQVVEPQEKLEKAPGTVGDAITESVASSDLERIRRQEFKAQAAGTRGNEETAVGSKGDADAREGALSSAVPEPIVPPVAPAEPAPDPNVSLDDAAGTNQAESADVKRRDRSVEHRELSSETDESSVVSSPPARQIVGAPEASSKVVESTGAGVNVPLTFSQAETQEKSWANIGEAEEGLTQNRAQGTDPISVGGTDPVNDEELDAVFAEHYGVNPFVDTEEDALATFAMDVDNASYTITRSYLERGALPPKDIVRVEEFINAFEHNYPPPGRATLAGDDVSHRDEGTFAIHLDAAPSRFGEPYTLLRVGLKGREMDRLERDPLVLTYVIDTSGSMEREGRLELVKDALVMLLDQLRPRDRVAIVAYGRRATLVAEHTSLRHRWDLEAAIRRLEPRGGTNAEAGLRLGYEVAERAYDPDATNRVILCSDGVANIGRTGPDSILEVIKQSAGEGIYLTSIGVGMGNYNDVLLEQLANKGDGNYFYVNDRAEARRVFVEDFLGTTYAIARDAKIQVEFFPHTVERHRLIGYENRDVADRDFRNDAVDAGEVGPGHEVTALFELKLADDATRREPLAVVRIRFEDPETGRVAEERREIRVGEIVRDFDRMDPTFRLDATVAEFAEILRESYWARNGSLAEVDGVLASVVLDLDYRDDVREFAGLVERARSLWADDDPAEWRERR